MLVPTLQTSYLKRLTCIQRPYAGKLSTECSGQLDQIGCWPGIRWRFDRRFGPSTNKIYSSTKDFIKLFWQ